eukprot:scaffold1265_cov366-Prasinococcus_capsulatus_cf.AAC.21
MRCASPRKAPRCGAPSTRTPVAATDRLVRGMSSCAARAAAWAQAIKRGDVDAIAFGRPYISNPDFAARVANGWPLAELAPVDTWFKPTDAIRADPNLGYTDWPVYAPSSEAS